MTLKYIFEFVTEYKQLVFLQTDLKCADFNEHANIRLKM